MECSLSQLWQCPHNLHICHSSPNCTLKKDELCYLQIMPQKQQQLTNQCPLRWRKGRLTTTAAISPQQGVPRMWTIGEETAKPGWPKTLGPKPLEWV